MPENTFAPATDEQIAYLRKVADTWVADGNPENVQAVVDPKALFGLLARLEAGEKADDRVAKLQAFKDYVHARLDAFGVPADPESPHKAEGCRIGGRLDWVWEQLSRNHRKILTGRSLVGELLPLAVECGDGVTPDIYESAYEFLRDK